VEGSNTQHLLALFMYALSQAHSPSL
jgi:hypothetical protein